MSNYQFSADLLADVLFRAGEPTNGTSDFNEVALTYINRAYQALWLGGTEVEPAINENWWWLLKEASIVTNAIINGSVQVVNGSAAITLSSAPAASVAGRHFTVTGHPETYVIAAHMGGATAATLDSIYLGATDPAAAYNIFQMDYSVAADVLRLATPMRLTQPNSSGTVFSRPGRDYQVQGLSNRELEETYPLAAVTTGIPRFFAQMAEQKVRFDQRTLNRVRIDYTYLQRPADLTTSAAEEPVIPRQYRRLIADIALIFLLVDKNDNRAEALSAVAKAGVRAMALENRMRLQVYGSKLAGLAPLMQVQTASPQQQG